MHRKIKTLSEMHNLRRDNYFYSIHVKEIMYSRYNCIKWYNVILSG